MFRKTVTIFLLISFLHFVGCYSTETISIKEIEEGTEQIDFRENITISTKDYNTYYFPAFQYQINNDTLYGTGTHITFGNELPFKGKIAMSDISSIKQEEVDAGSTTSLMVTLALIGAAVVGIILTVSILGALTPDN
ncbi:MAG: hypothetical protein KJN64_08030 [Ignavibacteria bacterium]|nr:hypothetical protein [Ignavibacteria bacterium]